MISGSNKFKHKYRITSNRMKNRDSGTPGYYFVTICTKDKIHWFGKVEDNKVKLSFVGEVARKFFRKSPTDSSELHRTGVGCNAKPYSCYYRY